MDDPTGLTVRDFLDEQLSPSRRIAHLEELCTRIARQPLDSTVLSLRAVLVHRIGLEDYRRLHVLISHLYHSCGASIPQTTVLRSEVNRAVRREMPTALETAGR